MRDTYTPGRSISQTSYAHLPVLALLCAMLPACGRQLDDAEAGATLAENVFQDCPECPVMVSLPPGRFLMGSPPDEGFNEAPRNVHYVIEHEKPQVEVEIAYPIAIGKYEVTFAEFDACVADGGCSHEPEDGGWGRGRQPVIYVNRADAEEYVAWLREETGRPYRLPSEAEWEYAARAGTPTARYWGEEISENHASCDGCGSQWDNRSPAPVGSFAPNPFGLYDMLGNVREWAADCWNPDLAEMPRDGSPSAGRPEYWENGKCRWPVRRGGDWNTYPWAIRAASRGSWRPGPWSDREDGYGFRVALALGEDRRGEPAEEGQASKNRVQ